MKHASAESIRKLAGFLDEVKGLQGLVERRPGIFYRKSKAFLHFHEHGDEIYADVRLVAGGDFERFPCSTQDGRSHLLALIKNSLEAPSR